MNIEPNLDALENLDMLVSGAVKLMARYTAGDDNPMLACEIRTDLVRLEAASAAMLDLSWKFRETMNAGNEVAHVEA